MATGSIFDYVKRRFKGALGHLVYRSGLYRRFLADRALIVVFHRVDDALGGNPISMTKSDFRGYCDFFARYYHVVPLSQLLEKLRSGDDISSHLAITFDDGYKDNFTNAAPELAKRNLPACFFVATNFIESNAVPWWDAEAGITPVWMTWDEVRSMHRQGFEFGPHTCNHVDLGKVVGDDARQEIEGSKARLDAELGCETSMFSYPYGRADQMRDENRDLVREAGLSCCLSAHGGVIMPGTDLYHLPRMPISEWYLSPYQFGFAALLAMLRERAGRPMATAPPVSAAKFAQAPRPAATRSR